MPCCRRIKTTSSPAAGLFVVLLVTVPVIESASAKPERAANIAAAKTKRRSEKVEKVTLEVYVKAATNNVVTKNTVTHLK
jgi:hypothetical protein